MLKLVVHKLLRGEQDKKHSRRRRRRRSRLTADIKQPNRTQFCQRRHKGNVVPVHAMKVQMGGEVQLHSFLIKEHQMEVVSFTPWPL
jgi:hypothetical protein